MLVFVFAQVAFYGLEGDAGGNVGIHGDNIHGNNACVGWERRGDYV